MAILRKYIAIDHGKLWIQIMSSLATGSLDKYSRCSGAPPKTSPEPSLTNKAENCLRQIFTLNCRTTTHHLPSFEHAFTSTATQDEILVLTPTSPTPYLLSLYLQELPIPLSHISPCGSQIPLNLHDILPLQQEQKPTTTSKSVVRRPLVPELNFSLRP